MTNKRNSDNGSENETKKPEHPKAVMERLNKEIIEECKLIATGLTESCYALVEKTKAYMSAEDKL